MDIMDGHPAAWRTDDLKASHHWVFEMDDRAANHVADVVKTAFDPDRPLFSYTREDFDFGPAWLVIGTAVDEAHEGRGIALVRGLPRARLTEREFELMTWGIGLHIGVARPQGKASQYISAVRDVGTDYRAATGRGYSSNAKLDFHVDGADLVALSCYNKAKSGGQSMITSGLAARQQLIAERPDLAACAHQKFYFSRQAEETADEAPFYGQPLFDTADGRVFNKWNRNRVRTAQDLEGVPPLTPTQHETMDLLDDIVRRPAYMYTMYLEPGDMQILNNHVMMHSRTDYVDFDDPAKKRLLCRLWLAPPNSVRLPDSWGDFFRTTAPGTVRGGIRGHHHDETCQAFERRQAESLGMTWVDPAAFAGT